MGAGFGFMFDFMSLVVPVVFVLILGMLGLRLACGARQWKKNNDSPVLSVQARVVGKRTQVSHHHSHNQAADLQSVGASTSYYATFQVESGDRMEFAIHGQEYGMLAEGDQGKLTFQGTRYLRFERERAGNI